MEIKIQELEMAHGLVAPRTGHPAQLKARILGGFFFNFRFLDVIVRSFLNALMELLQRENIILFFM